MNSLSQWNIFQMYRTFLFERCNIPLAISRAIPTLSLNSKLILDFSTLM